MRRLTAILLLCTLGAVGSGVLGYLHLQEHLRGHRAASVPWSSVAAADDDDALDEGACPLCMTLHLPTGFAGGLAAPSCLPVLVGLVVLAAFPQAKRRPIEAVACRGPPAA